MIVFQPTIFKFQLTFITFFWYIIWWKKLHEEIIILTDEVVVLIVRFQHIITKISITYQTSHLRKWRLLSFKNLVQALFWKNIFIIYCPRAIKIEPATSMKIDTEMVVFFPQNSKWFITSIFQGDKINKTYSQKQRLWIEILNKYFEETVEIKKISL